MLKQFLYSTKTAVRNVLISDNAFMSPMRVDDDHTEGKNLIKNFLFQLI